MLNGKKLYTQRFAMDSHNVFSVGANCIAGASKGGEKIAKKFQTPAYVRISRGRNSALHHAATIWQTAPRPTAKLHTPIAPAATSQTNPNTRVTTATATAIRFQTGAGAPDWGRKKTSESAESRESRERPESAESTWRSFGTLVEQLRRRSIEQKSNHFGSLNASPTHKGAKLASPRDKKRKLFGNIHRGFTGHTHLKRKQGIAAILPHCRDEKQDPASAKLDGCQLLNAKSSRD
jgi:hypothetical protein